MTDNIKSQLENAAENLSIEFQRVLINEMATEEGLVPVLMDVGSDPARYINIFSFRTNMNLKFNSLTYTTTI